MAAEARGRHCKQQGNLIAVERGGGRRQTSAAARARQEIDGEDPGKQLGPADAPRSGGRRGIVGRGLRQATVGVEQGELRGSVSSTSRPERASALRTAFSPARASAGWPSERHG